MKWDSPIIPRVLTSRATLRPLLQHRPLPQPLGALAREWHLVHHLVSAIFDVLHEVPFSMHYIWCSLWLVLQHAAFEFGWVRSFWPISVPYYSCSCFMCFTYFMADQMSIIWIFYSLLSQKLVDSVNIRKQCQSNYCKHHGTSHYPTRTSQKEYLVVRSVITRKTSLRSWMDFDQRYTKTGVPFGKLSDFPHHILQ
jgi:hypothetical protein